MIAVRACCALVIAVAVAVAAAGCGKRSSDRADLDPEALRRLPAPRACMKLSAKLTACADRFTRALRHSFIARGHSPRDAAMLAAAFATPPGERECARQPPARIERIAGCYSNDCTALAACVLNQPPAARDRGAEALRCPAGAAAYRSANGNARWCELPSGALHGPWRSDTAGTGTFSNGVPQGKFRTSGDRSETYAQGRIVKVGGVPVSSMKGSDIDTAIALAQVPRNTSAVSEAGLRRSLRGPDLAACADELRLRDRFPAGPALLVLDIGGDGAVVSASAQSFDAGLARCLEAKARSWRLPAADPSEPGTAWLLLSVTTIYTGT